MGWGVYFIKTIYLEMFYAASAACLFKEDILPVWTATRSPCLCDKKCITIVTLCIFVACFFSVIGIATVCLYKQIVKCPFQPEERFVYWNFHFPVPLVYRGGFVQADWWNNNMFQKTRCIVKYFHKWCTHIKAYRLSKKLGFLFCLWSP